MFKDYRDHKMAKALSKGRVSSFLATIVTLFWVSIALRMFKLEEGEEGPSQLVVSVMIILHATQAGLISIGIFLPLGDNRAPAWYLQYAPYISLWALRIAGYACPWLVIALAVAGNFLTDNSIAGLLPFFVFVGLSQLTVFIEVLLYLGPSYSA